MINKIGEKRLPRLGAASGRSAERRLYSQAMLVQSLQTAPAELRRIYQNLTGS